MNGIFKRIRQSNAFNSENAIPYTKIIALMSIFTFLFLGTEFLFVNRISHIVPGDRSVVLQNYALGISAVGFVLYPLFSRICKENLQTAFSIGFAVISIACLYMICHYTSYTVTLCLGLLLFLILGVFGSAVFYKSLCLMENNTHVARLTGISYMLGTVLQFINNNLIRSDMAEATILSIFLLILAIMLTKAEKNSIVPALPDSNDEDNGKAVLKTGMFLVIFVALMTCVFSTLDNAVTLYHANRIMNIGQWPRILLALSALSAGFLFDIADRKYMSIIMYCVMILSTACLVILQFSGPFVIGLIIFYLSAGFFAVFFTSSFMEIARYTKTPKLWAGLGRAINNFVAVAITAGSLSLLNSGNNIAIIIIELLLFVLTSISALFYTNKRKSFFNNIAKKDNDDLNDLERLQKLSGKFSLTPRETEVLGLLVNTEDGLQAIADRLYVSRRTLERYVSAIYEKTGAKSRIGLVYLYNNA